MQNLEISIYKRPFVLLSMLFSAGILFSFFNGELYGLLVITFFIASFILLIWINNYRRPLLGFVCISICCFCLGIVRTSNRLNHESITSFEEVYTDSTVVGVTLTEVQPSQKKWIKALGEIQFIGETVSSDGLSVPLVIFIEKSNYSPKKGDKVLISGIINEIKNKNNPGEFDGESYWKRKGYNKIAFVRSHEIKRLEQGNSNWIYELPSALRNYFASILSKYLSGNELAVAQALILGDKGLISQEVTMQFTNTGAMHVLAVSGLHIGIIMQILMKFFDLFSRYISKKNALITIIGIMWIYALITGLSPSVLRAVFMFTILGISQLSGLNYDAYNSLFFAAFVLLVIDPLTIFDIGFQLSFLAMLGIFLYYSIIRTGIYLKNKLFQLAWDGTAIGFAAQIMTTPLSLYYFHQFPNYFILSNLGLMATSGAVLGLGLALFALFWIPWLNLFIGFLLFLSLFLSLKFLAWVATLPGAVAYGFHLSFWVVIGLFVIAILYVVLRKNKYWSFFLWLSFLILFGQIIFNRYINLKKNEICLYNNTSPVISIKIGQHIFCMYSGNDAVREKANLLVTSYQKYNPGVVGFYNIAEKNFDINIEKHHVSSKKTKGKITIHVDQYLIEIDLKKEKWIDEINVSNSKKIAFNRKVDISDGAVTIPLN
jgi:competence protein ComEC